MARRRSKTSYIKSIWISIWLLWSMSAGILFSFGLLAYLNGDGRLLPVIIGAVMITLAIFTGKFTTETALAMRMKRR